MSIKVEEYLRKLEDEIQNRRTFHDGSYLMYLDEILKMRRFEGFSKNEIDTITLPDKNLRLYLKRFYCDDITSKECLSNEVVFSRLYNALGVNAVKYYPIIVNDNGIDENFGRDVAAASQDLNTVKGIQIEPFSSQYKFNRYISDCNLRISKLIANQDKLYDKCKSEEEIEKHKMILANFVTTGILDIICMMIDNHLGNKSVVRHNRIKTAEDIISFDLEDSGIDIFNDCPYADFKYELENEIELFAGFITIDGRHYTYIDCLNQIKKLRDEGYLPNESIELLKNIINLDFDTLLTSVESETGLIIPGNKKDYYKKLIDLNQETFSR